VAYTLHCALDLPVPPLEARGPTTTALGDWHAARLNIGWHRLVICVSAVGHIPVVTTARAPAKLPERLATGLQRLLQRLGVDAGAVAGEIAAMQSHRVAQGLSPDMLDTTREYGWAVRDLLNASDAPVTLDDVAWLITRTRGLDQRLGPLLGA
jgi:hypothetical protein